MSNEIGVVSGRYEQRRDVAKQVTIYNDANMFITSFSGGAWGACLQLTIISGKDVAYIQLNIPMVAKLADILDAWLEGKE